MNDLQPVGMITKEVDGRPFLDPDDGLLVEALAAAGIRLEPVAWNRPHWRDFPRLMVRSCWDYMDRYPEFLVWLDEVERSGIPVMNHPRVMRWNTSKCYVRDLGRHGAPVLDGVYTEAAFDAPSLTEVMESRGWQNAVVKPLVGVSSKGVFRTSIEEAQARQADYEATARSSGAVVLPYLGAVERLGERSVFYADSEFVHAVRKLPPAGDFRVSGEREVLHTVLDPVPPAVRHAAASVLQAAESYARHGLGLAPGAILYARVDLLPLTEDEGGPVVLNELELIEPSLYLGTGAPHAADRFARLMARRLRIA